MEYIVSSGEISSGIILQNDSMTALDGGIAIDTAVNSSGKLILSSGGTANSTTVNSRGIFHVFSGGIADSTILNPHGSIFVFSGGTADHITVNEGGVFRISKGGAAAGIIENGGYVYVPTGATASFVEHTFSGTVLKNTSATVHSGTTAVDTTVKDWGFLYVSSGGTAIGASVNVDGVISILGGTAINAAVNSEGSMHIRDGGTADHTSVNAGGCLFVSSGGTAANIVWTPCEGHIYVYDGGYATYASEYSGVYFGSGNKLLSNVLVMDGQAVDPECEMNVMNGGAAKSTEVNGGKLIVFNGGTADHTMINEDGCVTILSGGTANSTTVSEYGLFDVSSGAAADHTTVSRSAAMTVFEGASATDVMLNSGGELIVFRGATATGIVENGGSVEVENGANVSFVPNVLSGFVFSEASATVHSGTTANITTVNEGGYFFICSGGTANSTAVNFDGKLIVSGGGTATDIMLNSGGELYVFEGGTANSITVNCMGSIYVSEGGIAADILENGGYVEVEDGTTVSFLSNTLIGLELEHNATVHLNTIATSTAVNSGGGLYICGGMADHTTVNEGGKFTVSEDGRADSTAINSGGFMLVDSGGTAARAEVHAGGILKIVNGGQLIGIEIDSGADVFASSNGTAVEAVIHGGGRLEISNGGSASDTSVNSGGLMLVDSGGTADDIMVAAGGRLAIGDGGTVRSAVIQSGGVITGYIDCKDLTFDPGSILQFDLSVIPPGKESALVNLAGLAETQDCPVFTLPVSDSQDYGDYKLAEEARGFERQTISVSNPVMEFGSLSLDQSVTVGNRKYSLNLNDGDLILSVNATQPTQYVYLDFNGEELVRYSNPDLELSFDLSVADPSLSEEQRSAVVSALSEQYGKYNIVFTLERPEGIDYSTLYFGKSSAFDEYGDFFGIAETYDGNDQNKSDNAFILLDSGYSGEQILSVASHMLDHLMGFSYSGSVDGSPAILKYAESKELLSLSAGWDQGDPYNKYCPIYPVTEERCVVGCTNTAASQIIYYWLEKGLLDFTLSLTDSDAYRSNIYIMIESSDVPESGHLSFAETNKLMQGFDISDENCIAALCFVAGVVQQANYTSDETATSWDENLFLRAGFEKDEAAEHYANDFSSSYYDILAYELLHGRPAGVSIRSQRHAIVADGYDSSRNMFHLDFGWGTDNNRWYTTEEMDALGAFEGIDGFTPVASPDLTLENLSAGTDVVYLNDDVTLTFTISNGGREVSEEAMAYVYCGNALLGACGINYISPGCSREFSCTVGTASLKTGENVLTVKTGSQNDEGTVSSASVTVACKNGDVVPQIQTWEKIEGATQYIVEYSMDNFDHALKVAADTNFLDSYQLPEGICRMRVKSAEHEEWKELDPLISGEVSDDPKLIRSNVDGNTDVFFVHAADVWKGGYEAKHVGSVNDWSGTNEYASIVGRNKLADIIEGSADANILLMTDDPNGDALFVDDIYSASPHERGLNQSRIARIDEIRAGTGNDIVDMTSRRFEYIGDGLTIRGGDDDDVIWANRNGNFLFGDAGNDRIVGASGSDLIVGGIGNDRMHGGGGDDIFTFCSSWGIDTVEQTADGRVTLWFMEGSLENWNEAALTYTEGENTVTVSGVSSDKIELIFGNTANNTFMKFEELSAAAAFDAFSSRKIFDEESPGCLAGV